MSHLLPVWLIASIVYAVACACPSQAYCIEMDGSSSFLA